jgi:hypothetical protein
MTKCLALLGFPAVTGRWFVDLRFFVLITHTSCYLSAMPECRECTASGKHAQHTHETEKAAGNKFILESIAIDATEAEAARPGASKEAKEGLVYDLDAHCTVKRGQNHHQTAVYPPTLCVTPENPDPPSLSTLALEKITYTHRAIILHFGTLFFMVCLLYYVLDTHPKSLLKFQYLTHTSVQFYPREIWERSIWNVSKNVCFLLSFPEITADKIFRFVHSRSRSHLYSLPMFSHFRPLTWSFKCVICNSWFKCSKS